MKNVTGSNGSSLLIRPFEEHDQQAARQLILQGLGEHFGFIDEALNPDLNDIMTSYVRAGHSFLVAYSGPALVGTGALITVDEGTGRIVRVSTHRDYRRRGIGRTIVTFLLDQARERGYRRVFVETNNNWYDAIGLYQRLGFVEYGRNEHGVGMVMELD
ncbi:MAG TPA: GNAT family N-acetyltransferase [Ktedonobacteraceae bacterium]|jgi:ribosomal protein S18 acetylase RimI-like enzyme|nr:GNAT family N-acetyltransferase [Ktedonobacteraceae bacterium]